MKMDKVEIVKLWELTLTASDKVRADIVYAVRDDWENSIQTIHCWRADGYNRIAIDKKNLFDHCPTKPEKFIFTKNYLVKSINNWLDEVNRHSSEIVKCSREVVKLEMRLENLKKEGE